MKNSSKGWVFLKQIMSVLSSVVKAKSLALKNKTSALKSRLIILSFLKNKKIFFSHITHKLQALVAPGHDHDHDHDHHKNMEAAVTHDQQYGDQSSCSKAIVLYRHAMANESQSPTRCTELVKVGEEEELYGYQYDDGKYPDLTHSLFESEVEDEVGGSVIDLVRNCKEDGQNFNLEDEIDHVADLFIRRFHKQMKMQKLDSFKRYQEMLDRSV